MSNNIKLYKTLFNYLERNEGIKMPPKVKICLGIELDQAETDTLYTRIILQFCYELTTYMDIFAGLSEEIYYKTIPLAVKLELGYKYDGPDITARVKEIVSKDPEYVYNGVYQIFEDINFEKMWGLAEEIYNKFK